MANPAIFNSPHPATGAQAPVSMGNSTVYTKTQVDQKLSEIVVGLEHGLAVQSIVAAPPALAPVVDEVYIVSSTPTGAFVGHANNLATWDGTQWVFEPPQTKEAHMVEDQAATYSWNGTAWVKVASATTAAASGDLWQVGSIQQSLLTETQWATTLGAEATKWVLCDGRNVAGSKWATLTGQNTVPDMRGGFLRCAGQNSNTHSEWNGGTVGSYHNYTTARPRTEFTGTTSTNGQHHHNWGKSSRQCKGGGDYKIVDGWDEDRYTSDDGNHTHNVTINGGGDTETAPSHFSVNTFLKVN